jgi:hypothetical protein
MPTQLTVHEGFLHAYRQFWRTDPGLHLLAALCRSACQNCAAVKGWTKGGCLVAARGIQRYITTSLGAAPADIRVSLVAVATDETEAAHVLVALSKDGEERFLDAAGIWTRGALLCRLCEEYQYDAYELVAWEAVTLDRVRIPFDDQIAQFVEEALTLALGPFSPDWVFPASTLASVAHRPRGARFSAWLEHHPHFPRL